MSLKEETVAMLSHVAHNIHLHTGQDLNIQGSNLDSIVIVMSGVIKLSRITECGTQQIIGFLYPGSIIGSLDGNMPFLYEAEAAEESRVCIICNPNFFIAIMQKNPEIALDLLIRSNSIVNLQREHLLLLGCKSSQEKVASFFVSMLQNSKEFDTNYTQILLPLSRTEIANYLCMAPETLSRVTRRFERSGLITVSSRKRRLITVNNVSALYEKAGFSIDCSNGVLIAV